MHKMIVNYRIQRLYNYIKKHITNQSPLRCVAKQHIPNLSLAGSKAAHFKPLPPGEVSAKPTERDEAQNKNLLRLEKVARQSTNYIKYDTLLPRRMRSFSRQNGKMYLSSRHGIAVPPSRCGSVTLAF